MQYLKTYLFLATIAIVLSFSTCSNSNKIEKEEKNKTFSFDSLYLRPTDTSDIHFDFNRNIICYDAKSFINDGAIFYYNFYKVNSNKMYLEKIYFNKDAQTFSFDIDTIQVLKDTIFSNKMFYRNTRYNLLNMIEIYHLPEIIDSNIYEQLYIEEYDDITKSLYWAKQKNILSRIKYITQPYDELLADAQKEEKEDSFCIGHWSFFEKGYILGIAEASEAVTIHLYQYDKKNNNENRFVYTSENSIKRSVYPDTLLNEGVFITNIGKDSIKISFADSTWQKTYKLNDESKLTKLNIQNKEYFEKNSFFILSKNKAYQYIDGEELRILNKMNFNKYYLYKYGFIKDDKL